MSRRVRIGLVACLSLLPLAIAVALFGEPAGYIGVELFAVAGLWGLSEVLRPAGLARLLAAAGGALVFLANLIQLCALALTHKEAAFEFWYHFNPDAWLQATRAQRLELVGIALWLAATLTLLLMLFLAQPRRLASRQTRVIGMLGIAIGLAACIFFPSPMKSLWSFARRVSDARQAHRLDPAFAKSWGVKVTPVDESSLRISGHHRNLVLIYLESFEKAYLDEQLFPGLAPEMNRLRKEAVCFDNVLPGLNAGFTLGAIYSSTMGVHLIDAQLRGTFNMGMNVQVGKELVSLPQILHAAGYQQSFVLGHSQQFAGLNVVLARERYDNVLAGPQAASAGDGWLFGEESWGRYDSEVLDSAFDEYTRLAASGAPFNLTVLTLDTHGPTGRIAPAGEAYAGGSTAAQKQLLTALHRTDLAVGNFIARLKQTPAWSDTTVFITSDHLSWPGALDEVLAREPDRRMNSFALNAGAPRHIAVEGRTFDFAPTLLALLGVETNYQFPLGESLLDGPGKIRLQDQSTEQQEMLKAYILQLKSIDRAGDKFAVSVQGAPFPSLRIGALTVPLTVSYGASQAYPSGGEVCAAQLDESGQLIRYERSKVAEKIDSYFPDPHSDAQAILLGGPDSHLADRIGQKSAPGSYTLLYSKKGRTILKEAADPRLLSLSAEEIQRLATPK